MKKVLQICLVLIAFSSAEPVTAKDYKATVQAPNLNQVRIWADWNFGGDSIDLNLEASKDGMLEQMPKGWNDRVSSIAANLPEKAILVLYENANGTGKQYIIWGQGFDTKTEDASFNDTASSYRWFTIKCDDSSHKELHKQEKK